MNTAVFVFLKLHIESFVLITFFLFVRYFSLSLNLVDLRNKFVSPESIRNWLQKNLRPVNAKISGEE